MQSLSIPTVTEDALIAFHSQHFPGASRPVHFSYSNEDDDGLGWYADGVKRHLTDEQIAIFRHSELHRLSRARELAAELAAEDVSEHALEQKSCPLDSAKPEAPRIESPKNESLKKAPQPRPAMSLAEKTKHRRDRKKKQRRQQQTQKQHQAHQPATQHDSTDKRKWGEYVQDDEQSNPQGLTHRRIARELDEIKTESTELVYDD